MKNLIEKIASYKRATQTLIEKINEYEKFIKGNVPEEFWENFGIKTFGRGQFADEQISIGGSPIPSKTEKLGTGFYWGGDYNSHYYYCTGEELVDWAKELHGLVKEAEDFIESLTNKANEITESTELL